ncbi:MAG: hypothetical protein AAGI53_02985 [Planctomycetota bacterium]
MFFGCMLIFMSLSSIDALNVLRWSADPDSVWTTFNLPLALRYTATWSKADRHAATFQIIDGRDWFERVEQESGALKQYTFASDRATIRKLDSSGVVENAYDISFRETGSEHRDSRWLLSGAVRMLEYASRAGSEIEVERRSDGLVRYSFDVAGVSDERRVLVVDEETGRIVESWCVLSHYDGPWITRYSSYEILSDGSEYPLVAEYEVPPGGCSGDGNMQHFVITDARLVDDPKPVMSLLPTGIRIIDRFLGTELNRDLTPRNASSEPAGSGSSIRVSISPTFIVISCAIGLYVWMRRR